MPVGVIDFTTDCLVMTPTTCPAIGDGPTTNSVYPTHRKHILCVSMEIQSLQIRISFRLFIKSTKLLFWNSEDNM